ncbi:MAG TPA: nitroreductase family deazaflavin-dependent oxidoreductase [Acidimicrobiales bacterium]|nr:nitroreductase family deazaflavin-dependent oxidoreductase [Acidimicrobiales bacterium]
MDLSETFQRGVLRLHQRVYEATGGRIGHRLIGVPCLLLRTTGRRSGEPRTNALVYVVDGRDHVVVASNGGDDRAPGWLHNVRAQPSVEMQVKAARRRAGARVVERGDPDYDRLWALVNANNHGRYDSYQARTSRPIPLVVLTPE